MLIYFILRLLWLPLGCQIEGSGVELNGSGEVFVGLLGVSIVSENVKFSKKVLFSENCQSGSARGFAALNGLFSRNRAKFFKKST